MKNTFAEYTAYRLNFILWRVRMVIRLVVIYTLWQAFFSSQKIIFGYSENQILTYILISEIVANFVYSTRTQDLASEIQQGNLTNYLLRPVNYFGFLISRDALDKCLNVFFSCLEVLLLYLFFKPQIILVTDPGRLLLFILTVCIGVGLYFFISLILSLLTFWTKESWAPRFLFFIISDFLSGGLFPLDILPPYIYKILNILPFPYMLYFPLKIYLNQLSEVLIVQGILISLIWLGILFFAVKNVWAKGLRLYTAEGR